MKSYPNRPRTQSEAWLGSWPVLLRTLVTVFPSYTSRISRQPNPQWGQAVSTRLGLPGPAFHGTQVLRQGAHRAEGEAFPAGDAVVAVARRDVPRKSLSGQIDGDPARHLAAGAVAPAAENAPELPVPDERRGVGFLVVLPEGRVLGPFDPVFIDEVLEPALPALVALGAVQGVGDEEELDDLPPHPVEPLRAGRHEDALRRGRGAGGHGFAEALDLDDAEPAGAEGEQALMVAEGGDVDAPLARRLQDRLPGARRYPFAVDGQRYHFRFVSFGFGSPQGHHPDPVAAQAARRLATGFVDLEARLHLGKAPLPLFRGEHRLMRPFQAADEADLLLFVVHLDRGEQGLEPLLLPSPRACRP